MATPPSHIVASAGQGKVQLVVEAKPHQDVLHLTMVCQHQHPRPPHHHHHHPHHHHLDDVPYRATGALVRLQKSYPRLFLATAQHLNTTRIKTLLKFRLNTMMVLNDDNEIENVRKSMISMKIPVQRRQL